VANDCPCGDGPVTVLIRGPKGTVRACRRCAAVLEMIAKLYGDTEAVRRPVLSLVPSST
jgi:hypothetical protein